jgi:hypothetical protein
MDTRAVCATFAAAIGATLALASADALAGKPAPQPPPNPCIGAESRGFPALAFTRQRTTSGRVYHDTILADPSGQCQQTIFVADGLAPSRPAADVNLRYDAATRSGLVVRGGGAPGVTIAVSRYAVSFDSDGVPSVQAGPYSTLLSLADLATPEELNGWSTYVLANPMIAPDGTKMLAAVAFRQVQGTVETMMTTFWTCPFDAVLPSPVTASACRMVHRGTPGGSTSAGWGGRSDALYLTDTSIGGGAGRSLYRLPLATLQLSEIWSLGTRFHAARGSLDAAGNELVAVYEAGGASGCSRVLVVAANTCAGNGCTVLNGAGSPARSVTWLPDGRVAGEGQTLPNRKGQCSASGSIVAFEADEPNGTTTTIAPAGTYPDGAGGG